MIFFKDGFIGNHNAVLLTYKHLFILHATQRYVVELYMCTTGWSPAVFLDNKIITLQNVIYNSSVKINYGKYEVDKHNR